MKDISGWKELSDKPVSILRVVLSNFFDSPYSKEDWEGLADMDFKLDEYLGGQVHLIEDMEDLTNVSKHFGETYGADLADEGAFDAWENLGDFVFIYMATHNGGGDSYFIPIELAKTGGVVL